ncbi:MAG: sulfatase [Acidobacteriota bacterium]|nr:sulfatase [Acidobacteriota bacterium]
MAEKAVIASSSGKGRLSLSEVVRAAVWCGLVAGLAEGVIDLTMAHYHAPAMLSVSALTYPFLFVAVGALVWFLTAWLRGKAHRAAVFALLAGTATYSIGRAMGTFAPQWQAGVSALGIAVMAAVLGAMWAPATIRVVRRTTPWLVAVALVCAVVIPAWGMWSEREATEGLPAISGRSPNVLLIIVDTLRADHLTPYGYSRDTSPNIAQIAQQGALFETAISGSSWTLPSHATMMTGVYPHVHGVVTTRKELAPDSLTLPWRLREAGYRTGAFSANNFFFNRRYGLGQGFAHFGDYFFSATDAWNQLALVSNAYNEANRLGWRENTLGRQTAADINRAALRWILADKRPFFVALNYLDVHDPYVPPQPYRHMFSKKLDPGGLVNIGVNLLPHLSPAQMQDEMDAYDGGIRYDDAQIGKLLAALREHGLLKNTLVIITGDHGEAFGEHGLITHANALYFPLIHVPLIFRWPSHVPAGMRIAQPVSTKDIGATVLALVGQTSRPFPGRSLAELWDGQANASQWPSPISELALMPFDPDFPDFYGPLNSIITPTLQYIIDPKEGPLLYAWTKDPGEEHNLSQDPSYASALSRLQSELQAETHAWPSVLAASTRPTTKQTE